MAQQLDDDAQGNILGERETFIYTTNAGVDYNIVQDGSVSRGAGNTISASLQNPTLAASQKRPIKPRYILVSDGASSLKRKRVIIGDPANPLFTGASSTFIANGTSFTVRTRVGERVSAPKLSAAPPE